MSNHQESWLAFRWRVWSEAFERLPPVILWVLASLPAVYGFVYGYLSDADQAKYGLPWWVWLAYYFVLFAIHFEVGVIARIRELEGKVDATLPSLSVSVNAAFAVDYDANSTLVLLAMGIFNTGAPSAVIGYFATVKLDSGEKYEAKNVVLLNKSINVGSVAGMPVLWNPIEAINQNNDPIATGGVKAGRLPLVVPARVTSQVLEGTAEIVGHVNDVHGRQFPFTFRGSGRQTDPGSVVGERLATGPAPEQPKRSRPARQRRRRHH
jgi:hypothetical protein